MGLDKCMLGSHMFGETSIVAEPTVAPRGPTGNFANLGRRGIIGARYRAIGHGCSEVLGLELKAMSYKLGPKGKGPRTVRE